MHTFEASLAALAKARSATACQLFRVAEAFHPDDEILITVALSESYSAFGGLSL